MTFETFDQTDFSSQAPPVVPVTNIRYVSGFTLCGVVKSLIVSGAQGTDRQCVLLSCCGQLKNKWSLICTLYSIGLKTFQGENCGREALHWKQTVINFHSRPL